MVEPSIVAMFVKLCIYGRNLQSEVTFSTDVQGRQEEDTKDQKRLIKNTVKNKEEQVFQTHWCFRTLQRAIVAAEMLLLAVVNVDSSGLTWSYG